MKVSSVLLAISFLLTLVFTFSCSSDGNSSDIDRSSNSVGESSSSNEGSSSSSSYVVNSSDSSSSIEQSSSSSEPSNSSATSSSSSETSSVASNSSSSSELSSSSATSSSSSSELPSSSSITLSNSSSCDDFVDGTQKEHYGMQKKQFCDERDGKKYVYVTIGEGDMAQTWMAENLNYNTRSSECYNNLESYCTIYGRLYNWADAMNAPYSCNGNDPNSGCPISIAEKHKGICPNGWHIPNDDEWSNLEESVGGSSMAGKYLKATEYWNNCTGSETFECIDTRLDSFGFAALPGGAMSYIIGVGFLYASDYGYWWSSTKWTSTHSNLFSLSKGYEKSTRLSQNKQYSFSVRCVKD